MKLGIIFLALFVPSLLLATVVEKNEDKIYQIEKINPEIKIGDNLDQGKNEDHLTKRSLSLWSLGIVRSSLSHTISSFASSEVSIDPLLVGIFISKKTDNYAFSKVGYYELSGSWQRFERESSLMSSTVYSQKIDIYEMAASQNFIISQFFNKSARVSLGLGIAPIYLAAEQSVLANSISEVGAMGFLKMDLIIPYQKIEVDLALKASKGKANSKDISMLTFSLGLNFE